MDDDDFLVRFWGVRGSIAVSGPEFARYGGNTICIEMRCGKHTLLFDAGSGLRPAGRAFQAADVTDFNLLFTHCHYDHIIGLRAFAPIFDLSVKLTVWYVHL